MVFHWSEVSGGVHARSPYAMIHGYMSCDALISGDLAHSCRHGRGPHSIKICVVRKDNDPAVFKQVSTLAGPKPERESSKKHVP